MSIVFFFFLCSQRESKSVIRMCWWMCSSLYPTCVTTRSSCTGISGTMFTKIGHFTRSRIAKRSKGNHFLYYTSTNTNSNYYEMSGLGPFLFFCIFYLALNCLSVLEDAVITNRKKAHLIFFMYCLINYIHLLETHFDSIYTHVFNKSHLDSIRQINRMQKKQHISFEQSTIAFIFAKSIFIVKSSTTR